MSAAARTPRRDRGIVVRVGSSPIHISREVESELWMNGAYTAVASLTITTMERARSTKRTAMPTKIIRLKARPLLRALRSLGASGARLPSVAVGGYRISLQPSSGRAYARFGRAFLGRLGPSGVFRAAPSASTRDLAALRALVERTLDVARGAALLAGTESAPDEIPRCAFCGRPLGKLEVGRGIGRRCWEKAEAWRLEKETTAGVKRSSKMNPVLKHKSKRRQKNG